MRTALKKEKGVVDLLDFDPDEIIDHFGKESLLELLRKMFLIRNFELRGEAAYQQGKVGGFYHSYMGQEAIQTAIIEVFGTENWFSASYRCHALALLLGATPKELMAELYGKATGNALGRGGSMHFYTERLLGGFGIVGGQIPIAIGSALAIKRLKKKGELAICFFGDGAVAQGAFHESLNIASLWELPCLFIIENNQWGMGTAVNRAISVDKIAEKQAVGYGMSGYTLDGRDILGCLSGLQIIKEEIDRTGKPVLVEAVTERFRGHSISDPGNYRTKDDLKNIMAKGPKRTLLDHFKRKGWLDDEGYKEMDKETRQIMVDAMKYAEESPWPDLTSLEEGVFA